jgi:hypothetical protein
VGIATATESINAAIIFNHLFFWLKINKARNDHFHDGRTWMYQSMPDIALHFSYLSEKQVRDSLDILIKKGFIIKGRYSKNKFDRTNWYALSDENWLAPYASQKTFTKYPGSHMDPNPGVTCNTDNNITDNKEREREGAAPPALASFSKKEIERAEHVHTSDEEHATLIKEHGEKQVLLFYELLSNWKKDTPRSKWKKNDYRSILRWVVAAASEAKNKNVTNESSKDNKELCKRLEKKFNRNDISVGYDYIEFINGPACAHIKFNDKDFKEKFLLEITKRKIKPGDI